MKTTQRIQDLVIGAGAVGVACAEALALAGRDVLLVDRGAVCSGCSHGNAGWVTPCHSLPLPGSGLVKQTLKWMLRGDSPLYIKPTLRPSRLAWLWRFYRHCNEEAQLRGLQALAELNRQVVPLTRELVERYGLDCQYEQRGITYVFRTEAGFEKGIRECELLHEHGIPGEILQREAVHTREPVLSDDVCGGVFYPGEADCVPDQFVKQLAARLPQLGVRILTDTEVERFEVSGREITAVATSAGTIQPENVILAAGSWTLVQARKLGLQLPMEPGKGYSVTLRRQPGIPKQPLNLSEAKVGVTPWQDTIRFAGTMELAGLQLKINQRRVDAIIREAKRFLPQFQAEDVLETWTGMRPMCSDGLPIIGRTSKLKNLFLATGHGMLGLTQAVVTGRLVADLVTSQRPLVPVEPFSPDRC
ncbi:MAG: FAD-dependent oxidoreductase [Planctomycetaceae bacterium]|nr:FAD-dependent oxidoreductase [Planctomycetaceae bacterium]